MLTHITTDSSHPAYKRFEEVLQQCVKGTQTYGPNEVRQVIRLLSDDSINFTAGSIRYYEQIEVVDVLQLATDISKVRRITGLYPPKYRSYATSIAMRYTKAGHGEPEQYPKMEKKPKHHQN